ncbi:MAG TPA: hypothetical protein VNQ90_19525 [Chthoniobacteraceae bacterium]|nr:hypothetical protein [Chthoniobacteraceae bacterium]
MIKLDDIVFSKGALPEGWTESKRDWSFEEGAIRVGKAAHFHLPLPGDGWERVRVEVEVESDAGAIVGCGEGALSVWVDLKSGISRVAVYEMAEVARQPLTLPPGGRRCRIAFELDEAHVRGFVEGVEAVAAPHPGPSQPFRWVELQLWGGCLLHRVRLLGERPAPGVPCGVKKEDGFYLEVCVDFIDDLRAGPWTAETFDQLFREFESWGVKRCHWICYGGSRDGWWYGARGVAGHHARLTFENVGDIFAQAVRSAHRYGIEIYALLKPFDMGFWPTHGEGTAEAAAEGKLRYNGGWIYWIADFAARNRQWITARKPALAGESTVGLIQRIDLVKEDEKEASFHVGEVRLYVSDDNVGYRLYDGPMVREEVVEEYPVWEHTASGGRPTGRLRKASVLRMHGLAIASRYIALGVDGADGSFANDLLNLVHLFGEKGEERRLTYGLKARVPGSSATERPDFRSAGVEFDVWPGTASAIFPGFDGIRARWALDSRERFLAVARGKETGPVAVFSPAFPEVRAWWLGWLKESLDAGADGIELRVRNHHGPLTWGEFGFEKPVRDEFLRRHGVDLWETDDFDKEAWRRLRGEGYTQFLREARALALSYGKPMGLHLSPTLNMEPDQGAAMEIHWDWRAWLLEGLADSVTMKEIWPGTRFAQEILSLTRPRGIATIFAPYANLLWRRPGGEEVVENWIHRARNHGYDGFQYYEGASVTTRTPCDGLKMLQPGLRTLFQREFSG